jgi:hypothetical protein
VTELALLAGAGLALVGLVAAASTYQRSRLGGELVCFELRFGRGLEVAAVQSFLVGICGLLPPWWRRWLIHPFVVLEVEASEGGVVHRLSTPSSCAQVVEHQLQASLPDVSYRRVPISRGCPGSRGF